MSDTVRDVLMVGIPAVCAAFVSIAVPWLAARNNAKMTVLVDLARETKHMVNSGSLIQLKLNVRTAKRLAAITGEQQDIDDWRAAEQMVTDHEAAQAKADADKQPVMPVMPVVTAPVVVVAAPKEG